MAVIKIRQMLNDENRKAFWEAALPDFDFGHVLVVNEAVRDYLVCYGLAQALEIPGLRYHAGFRPYGKWRIFQQYFALSADAEPVVLVHGYTDHAGLFAKLINYLLASGRSVFVFDLPGHGLSSGERATIDSFDSYIDVLCACLEQFQNHVPGPCHLVAQSMGAAITMDALQQYRIQHEDLARVVLLAPLVRAKAWNKVVWASRLIGLFSDSVARPYGKNSEDARFVDFVRHGDPLQHRRLPVQWVKAMIAWNQRFESYGENSIPLWIMQGDHDETVDWRYNLAFLDKHFPNAHQRLIPGAGHHLAGESERLQAILFAYMEEAFCQA